jgi:hypothetical protein
MKVVKRLEQSVWIVMLVLSLLLTAWTALVLLGGPAILQESFELAGSTMDVSEIDEAALGFLNMAMLKPLWEELWIGISGVYCALALRRRERHAWTLSLFWGIMLLTNAVIQGGYEVVLLNWSNACLQTYLFLLLGAIAVTSLLFTRNAYIRNQMRREA